MTTSPSTTPSAARPAASGGPSVAPSRDLLSWGLGSFAAAAVIIVLGNTDLQKGENGGTVGLLVSLAICAAAAGLLYGRVLPHTARPARTARIIGVVTVVSVPVFWTGLPIVLGAAAVLGGRGSGGSTSTRVVVALAGVAATATFVVGLVTEILDRL
jgi:hypothetical protein